jgi:hypothetical protein
MGSYFSSTFNMSDIEDNSDHLEAVRFVMGIPIFPFVF